MLLLVVLLIAGCLAAFFNAASLLVKPGTKLEAFKVFLDTITVPFGIACGVIALANAFNFWIVHYPLISWLVLLANAVIILRDFLVEKLRIPEGPGLKILDTLVRYRAVAGMVLLVICIIRIITLVSPFFDAILL